MKNNYVKYGLIALVVFIWGRLLINYFGLFTGEDDIEYVPEVATKPYERADSNKVYELKLNYKDPFLGNSVSFYRTKKTSPTNNIVPPIKAVEPPKKEALVVYKGIVKNNNSSKRTGLVEIDGKNYLITSIKEIGDIKIVDFNDKELIYFYGDKKVSVFK